MNSFKNKSTDYYLKSRKFIRDLVLGYVYLTEFDIEIIDTLQFQRLKDIRQLTCQQVFPSARHTRFEHSLGVMELTRQAIRNLNKNGFISDSSNKKEAIINEQLQFNAALAALLHDIGHCPFSHLGESEFDSEEIWNTLLKDVKDLPSLKKTLYKVLIRCEKNNIRPGSKHEQLSCIIILEKYKQMLLGVKEQKIKTDSGSDLSVDFELIIRCILGITYDVSTNDKFINNKEKNIIINLINSDIFDMDKLDYIMRDSLFTGIGAPRIDTHRLFRNMYLNNDNEYKIVFSNRAVPALQNMIESRDELYMYVYNHHTSVFTDFMYSYIFRRLTHNESDFLSLVKRILADHKGELLSEIDNTDKFVELNFSTIYDPIVSLGIVSKDYLFSIDAIIEQNRSDSDLISLLKILHSTLSLIDINDKETIIEKYKGEIDKQLFEVGIELDDTAYNEILPKYKKNIETMCDNPSRVYKLIDRYQRRNFFKPWWKTNSEFSNFINNNFLDDRVREKLCKWVCHGDDGLQSDEFRSQLAKNVSYITRRLIDDKDVVNSLDLIQPLKAEEFFVIKRSARFFDPDTISGLDIALKSNEILGSPVDVKYCTGDFYIKSLNNVIPQRDYYSMYAKNSFYIFSKSLDENINNDYNSGKRNRHYHFIEQIFVFVATTLINDGVRLFNHNYPNTDDCKKEDDSHEKMYVRFKKDYLHIE